MQDRVGVEKTWEMAFWQVTYVTACGTDFLHTAHIRQARWIMCLCVSGTEVNYSPTWLERHLCRGGAGLLLLSCKYWLESLVMSHTWPCVRLVTPLELVERETETTTWVDALSSASACLLHLYDGVKLGFVHSVHYLVRHRIIPLCPSEVSSSACRARKWDSIRDGCLRAIW